MRRRVAVVALLCLVVLTACGGHSGSPSSHSSRGSTSSTTAVSDTENGAAPSGTAILPDARQQVDAQSPRYAAATSRPRQDPVYPNVGDPSLDALHYGLDLAWTPSTRTLQGIATIVFRAPADENQVRLDLAASLHVSGVTLDGQLASFSHPADDLVVSATVARDSRHVLEVHYGGVPEPAAAPTTRPDLTTLGWTTTHDGSAWTIQEPYGAFTWYPVDDQPADKAFYDISVTTTAPFVGVANGKETSSITRDGQTTTSWHLDQPASSYLVTVAIGPYVKTTNTSADGTAITYWVPSDASNRTAAVHQAGDALNWVESKLGPYPFASLGFVLVDSTSGMETQTMITLGTAPYDVAEDTLVHELVHQWYGDEVTPSDWRDLWMNEGMAMYLQFMWEAQQAGVSMAQELARPARQEAHDRATYGPPAHYDPADFASDNVYYGPALMYQALRQRIGDARFFRVIKAWPATHRYSSQSRQSFESWWVEHTGVPRSFFDAWLLSPTTPPLTLS